MATEISLLERREIETFDWESPQPDPQQVEIVNTISFRDVEPKQVSTMAWEGGITKEGE